MKITQELIDNGQKIVHLNYEKSDIEKIKKLNEKTTNSNTEETEEIEK